jgi:hypothetical protein
VAGAMVRANDLRPHTSDAVCATHRGQPLSREAIFVRFFDNVSLTAPPRFLSAIIAKAKTCEILGKFVGFG